MTSGSGSASRSVFLVTVGNLSAPLVALATAPILARELGAVGRGELAAATAPLLLLAAALTLGAPEAATYFVARNRAAVRNALKRTAGLLVALGGIGVGCVYFIAPVLASGSPDLTFLIRIAICLLPLALALGVLRGIARGRKLWVRVALEQVIGSIFKLGGLVLLLITGNLTVMTATFVLATGVVVGSLSYIGIGRTSPLEATEPDLEMQRVLRFGMPVWLGSVSGVALAKLDQILILPLAGAAVLGIYALSASLADAIRVFNSAVRDVVFANQSSRLDDAALATAARVSTLITVCAGVILVLLSAVLVVPIFGQDFAAAPPVIAVLVIGIVLGNPGSVTAAGLSARGRPLLRSLAIASGLLVNIVLIFTLVPAYGALGAALATAVANVVSGVMSMIFAKFVFDLPVLGFLGYRKQDGVMLLRVLRRFFKRKG